MYESFFDLSERPFTVGPVPQRYYPGKTIEEARKRLTRSVQRSEGPGLLIGPTGCGKSLLCHVLAEQFQSSLSIVHLESSRLCTRRALLQAILHGLGIEYRDLSEGELRLSLIDHVSPGEHCPGGMLLIVDEAHTLPLRLMEELRMITNLVRDGLPRVQLVLAGSAVLEERFASPKLESFNQRLATRCYLEAFDHQDTVQYIRAQMSASGGAPDEVFTPDGLDAIRHTSDGIPRLINQLCDHALGVAAERETRIITAAIVEEAWADLQQLPTPWAAPAETVTTEAAESAIEFGSLDEDSTTFEPLEATEEMPEPVVETSEPIAELPAPDTEALPFPPPSALEGTASLLERPEQFVEELADLDEEFLPAGSIGTSDMQVRAEAHDPFAEPYEEEEEIVIDRFASFEDTPLHQRTTVESRESAELAHALQQAVPSVSVSQTPSLVTVAPPEANESDLPTGSEHLSQPMARLDEPNQPAPYGQSDPVMPEDDQDSLADTSGEFLPEAPSLSEEPFDSQDEAPDLDILLIDEEPIERLQSNQLVRRQEYGQLFARLRRG